VYLPWPGFREGAIPPAVVRLTRPKPWAYEIAARAYGPAWGSLGKGVQALHARNVHILAGPGPELAPVAFLLTWTEEEGKGGTGQALRQARLLGVPIFNLARKGALEELALLVKARG
ncbi:hypothetical protein, partial [Fervidobacterium sp.]